MYFKIEGLPIAELCRTTAETGNATMSEEEDVIFDDIYELCEIIGRLATVIILVLINCVNSFRDLVRSGMFKEL